MKNILIADSGGSKTDWCYINLDGKKEYFKTSSFHPNEWGDDFFEKFQSFWDEKKIYSAKVYFFGAGCLNQINNDKMKEIFNFWGFKNVHLYSDIHGAGIALFGKGKGVICLLGTGSVVAHYDNGKVSDVKGGLGYLIGDEGSGVNFGKIILNKLLNGLFSIELTTKLYDLLGERSEIFEKMNQSNAKDFLASISKLIGENNSNEIRNVHLFNLEIFISLYLKNLKREDRIGVIGSYGFYNQSKLSDLLNNRVNFNPTFEQYPISKIAEYLSKHTF